MAAVGRVLVVRRPEDHVDDHQTAVPVAGRLPPDRDDVGRLQPDHLRLDELQHPERVVPTVQRADPATARGHAVHGDGYHGRPEQNQTVGHVQHVQLHTRQSGDILQRRNRTLESGDTCGLVLCAIAERGKDVSESFFFCTFLIRVFLIIPPHPFIIIKNNYLFVYLLKCVN